MAEQGHVAVMDGTGRRAQSPTQLYQQGGLDDVDDWPARLDVEWRENRFMFVLEPAGPAFSAGTPEESMRLKSGFPPAPGGAAWEGASITT